MVSCLTGQRISGINKFLCIWRLPLIRSCFHLAVLNVVRFYKFNLIRKVFISKSFLDVMSLHCPPGDCAFSLSIHLQAMVFEMFTRTQHRIDCLPLLLNLCFSCCQMSFLRIPIMHSSWTLSLSSWPV